MIRRKLLAVLLAISGLVLGATPAFAAAGPPNDKIAGATAIASLPFSDTVDTTKANTDAEELAAAQPCLAIGAPAIEKAVWYKYVVPANITLHVQWRPGAKAKSFSNPEQGYAGIYLPAEAQIDWSASGPTSATDAAPFSFHSNLQGQQTDGALIGHEVVGSLGRS